LDHLIRERLDQRRIGDASGQLEDRAIRAVLDVELHPSTQARFISDQKWFHAGQEAFRLAVIRAIADELGITPEAPK
jgi:isopenicillin N synthase-like dioxygenase